MPLPFQCPGKCQCPSCPTLPVTWQCWHPFCRSVELSVLPRTVGRLDRRPVSWLNSWLVSLSDARSVSRSVSQEVRRSVIICIINVACQHGPQLLCLVTDAEICIDFYGCIWIHMDLLSFILMICMLITFIPMDVYGFMSAFVLTHTRNSQAMLVSS